MIYQLPQQGKKEIERKAIEGNSFKTTVNANSYYSFEILESKQAAMLPPSFNGSKTAARMTLDPITTIGAKLGSIIAEKALAGDSASKQTLREKSLAMRDV